jgi:hypothetical protein
MIQKEITLQGKTYPVVFDMQTIINFEEIARKTFFGDPLEKLTDRIAIIAAAVLSADENSDLKLESLKSLDWNGIQELLKAYSIIMEMSLEFFNIPKVIDKPEKQSKANGKKNA